MDERIPPLTRKPPFWIGKLLLPAFAECSVQWAWSFDNFFPSSSRDRNQGPAVFQLNDEQGEGPDAAQRNALNHLHDNQNAIADVSLDLLKADLLAVPSFLGTEGWPLDEIAQRDRVFSTVLHGDGIRQLVWLSRLTVHKRQLNEHSYISLVFRRAWDWEHDHCVVIHQSRIVVAGDPGWLCTFEEKDFPGEGEPVYGYP